VMMRLTAACLQLVLESEKSRLGLYRAASRHLHLKLLLSGGGGGSSSTSSSSTDNSQHPSVTCRLD